MAGCLFAKFATAYGFAVTLFERQPHLLTGASGRNWFRFHLGPHYPLDDATSSEVMEASMVGAQYLRGFLYEGIHSPEYYIHPSPTMQQTLPCGAKLDAKAYLIALQKQRSCYERLLRQYPAAEAVFGRVDRFYTELHCSMKNFTQGCCLGVSSAERLMELSRLNHAVAVETRNNPLITVHTSSQVEDIRWSKRDGFELDVQSPQGMKTMGFDQVVQAGWGNGLSLDLRLVNNLRIAQGMDALTGANYAGHTLHRLKVYALVRGTEVCDTVTHKLMMSPKAASYAYLGPGVGIAEATHINTLASSNGLCPTDWDKALRGEDDRVHEVAKASFEYCRGFFPFLQNAECVSGMAASVLSGLDTGKRSADALRHTGVEQFNVRGYHSVGAMKLSNLPLAAVTTLRAVMDAHGGEFGVDKSEAPEVTLQRLAEDPAFQIHPAPLSLIERIIGEEQGPLEAFRWGTIKQNS
jgi:hypothetical protein